MHTFCCVIIDGAAISCTIKREEPFTRYCQRLIYVYWLACRFFDGTGTLFQPHLSGCAKGEGISQKATNSSFGVRLRYNYT